MCKIVKGTDNDDAGKSFNLVLPYNNKITQTSMNALYTVSGEKKRPQFSRHNFDKFSHSFVVYATSHPDTSAYYKALANLAQHCNIVTKR